VAARARVKGRRTANGFQTPDQADIAAAVAEPLEEDEAEALVALEAAGIGSHVEAGTSDASNPFQQLGLDELFTVRLAGLGFPEPTEVQKAAIPSILSRRNTAIASYTGSGKTIAYLLPALQLAVEQAEALLSTVDPSERAKLGPTAIIVAPSRELAMQILKVARQLLPEEAGQAVQQLIGGANIHRQDEALKTHQPIMVVGTPGRLAEHSRRGTLATHRTGLMVLDEADQLLAPNFREDLLRLTQHAGKRLEGGRQTVLVSATLTAGVLKNAARWCPEPECVFVHAGTSAATAPNSNAGDLGQPSLPDGDDGPTWGWGSSAGGIFTKSAGSSSAAGVGNQDAVPAMPPGLSHYSVESSFRHKADAVRRAIHALGAERVLIFMNFQQRIKDVEAKLGARRMLVAGLHGELTQMQRKNVLQGFRNGKFRALIVSDVAARGLDVEDCDAVINLELPSEATHYAHRAGRTGRGGRSGTVVTIVANSEQHVIRKMSDRLGINIQEAELKDGFLVPKTPPGSAISQ